MGTTFEERLNAITRKYNRLLDAELVRLKNRIEERDQFRRNMDLFNETGILVFRNRAT